MMQRSVNILLAVVAAVFLVAGFLVAGNGNDTTSGRKNNHAAAPVKPGDKAPDLTLKDPDGKELSLSSLKGKVVLLDFWASWCRPCRMENPNLVEAYQKYSKLKFKDAKGFEIFSVSLDKNADSWKNAIKKDNLSWKYHVSDLKGWSSEAAQIYRVNAIPAQFLIDAEGTVIAKNLRGVTLHYELDKLVKW